MTQATAAATPALDELREALARDGFTFVHAAAMRQALERVGPLDDWDGFAASWNDLPIDSYMADGGRYRRRRHGVYRAADRRPVERQPHQPHYQSLDYNPLHGGLARVFAPIDPEVGASASLTTILSFCRTLFDGLSPDSHAWRIEVHQFRIEARHGEPGRPTPEGLHRDGVDYVLVLLIDRQNIASGTTGIHAPDGSPLGQFALTTPCDAALVDDHRVAHGVTPVEAIDAREPAFRDVLVVTFLRSES